MYYYFQKFIINFGTESTSFPSILFFFFLFCQSGVYGVSICAEFGGSGFKPFVSGNKFKKIPFNLFFLKEGWLFNIGDYYAEALAKINNVLQSPDALAPDHTLAYQNAVLALGWICKIHRFRTRAKVLILYFSLWVCNIG